MERLRNNPWLLALVSWLVATCLVTLIFTLYKSSRGEAVNWVIVRNAAAFAAIPAVIMSFRDWRRSKNQ